MSSCVSVIVGRGATEGSSLLGFILDDKESLAVSYSTEM